MQMRPHWSADAPPDRTNIGVRMLYPDLNTELSIVQRFDYLKNRLGTQWRSTILEATIHDRCQSRIDPLETACRHGYRACCAITELLLTMVRLLLWLICRVNHSVRRSQ